MLRKIPLALKYYGENSAVTQEHVMLLDVQTRDGAEWLKFNRHDGVIVEIRLDAIISV